VSSRVIASTKPAPLEVTNRTSHMVTPGYLLNEALTFLTLLDIWSILPVLYLLPKSTLTTRTRVSLSIAFITYFSAAFWAFACFFTWICAYHNWTFRIWAPFQVRTLLDFQISDEKFVFVESRHISKVSYEVLRQNNSTMGTRNFFNSHITDLHKNQFTSYLI
jgi:hypothetical protein